MRISDWSSDVCSSDLLTCRYPLVLALATLSEICPIAAAWALIPSMAVSIEAKIDMRRTPASCRSEELRVGKAWSVRVDLGGRRIIKIKHEITTIMINL